jgi:coatomer subunit beta
LLEILTSSEEIPSTELFVSIIFSYVLATTNPLTVIHAIHQIGIRFPEVAAGVVGSLMDFIAEINNSSAVDVISFVKEVTEKFPKLRSNIVERLTALLGEQRASKVYRGSLWVIGEYCEQEKEIREAWKRIRQSLGEIPILNAEKRALEDIDNDEPKPDQPVNGHAKQSKVLADGTYATESALTSQAAQKSKLEAVRAAQKPPLRQLILDGEYVSHRPKFIW